MQVQGKRKREARENLDGEHKGGHESHHRRQDCLNYCTNVRNLELGMI